MSFLDLLLLIAAVWAALAVLALPLAHGIGAAAAAADRAELRRRRDALR